MDIGIAADNVVAGIADLEQTYRTVAGEWHLIGICDTVEHASAVVVAAAVVVVVGHGIAACVACIRLGHCVRAYGHNRPGHGVAASGNSQLLACVPVEVVYSHTRRAWVLKEEACARAWQTLVHILACVRKTPFLDCT